LLPPCLKTLQFSTKNVRKRADRKTTKIGSTVDEKKILFDFDFGLCSWSADFFIQSHLQTTLPNPSRPGVPNLGDTRGLKSVISWVHLYQWGDAIVVRGDTDTKRLGTPDLDDPSIR
jgi:hypothetical protein